MMTKTTALRTFGAVLMACAVIPWIGAGTAIAVAPPSGDTRATSFEGNAVDCDDAGLAGTIITVTSTQDGTLIDITAVPAGKTVTGVVVKGGDAYNVYLPAALGALPWNDLHAPLNGSEGPAGISHWYVCATDTPPTTATTPPPPPTTSSAPASVLPTKASTTPEDETSVEGTKAGRAPNVLPRTGSGMSLGTGLAISFGLLLGGAALLFVPRRLALEKGQHRRH